MTGKSVKPRYLRLIVLPLALIGPVALSHIWYVDKGIHFKVGKVDFAARTEAREAFRREGPPARRWRPEDR